MELGVREEFDWAVKCFPAHALRALVELQRHSVYDQVHNFFLLADIILKIVIFHL